jgi:hypothetical protein
LDALEAESERRCGGDDDGEEVRQGGGHGGVEERMSAVGVGSWRLIATKALETRLESLL